jgi:biotin-(acetyl-CoA carboxylase) ligase
VLGIGINANIPKAELPTELATSLLLETERELDPADLLVELLDRLERRYDEWVSA